MRYMHGKRRNSRKNRFSKRKALLFGIVAVVIIVLIIIKKSGADEIEIDNTETEVQETVLEVEKGEVEVIGSIEEIEMYYDNSSLKSGFARRGLQDGKYTYVSVLDLPQINTAVHFYEAWLVVPGVMEFISIGDLFSREDGQWGLVWEADELKAPANLFEYSSLVITRELTDGDESPSPHHMAEGNF